MYLIIEGKVSIFNNNKKKCTVGPMNSIGELALETGHLRAATVISSTNVTVAVIHVEDYQQILAEQKRFDRHEVMRFFQKIPQFADVSSSKLEFLARNTMTTYYESNSIIYDIGDDPHALHLVKEGLVQLETLITLTKKNNLPIDKVLVSIKQYNYPIKTFSSLEIFGNEEIMEKSPRYAKATAKLENTVVYSIPSSVFTQIFSTEELLKMNLFSIKRIESRELRKCLSSEISNKLRRLKTMNQLTLSKPKLEVFTDRTHTNKPKWISLFMNSHGSSIKSSLVHESFEFQNKQATLCE